MREGHALYKVAFEVVKAKMPYADLYSESGTGVVLL